MLPEPKSLFTMTIGASGDDGQDDLADVLQEMHGHMSTGNYKGAAEAMRAAHRICSYESSDHAGSDGDGLYED